jgi:two-component system chemotaxis sensor kinase CheA
LPAPEDARRKAIIVRRNGEPYAFAVDRMLGQQEVVVRPIEDALVRVHGVAGTTDLGDGRPTLVLDLAALGGRLVAATAEVSP